MRLILGILIGIGITLGAAYVHDMNLPAAAAAPSDGSPATPDLASRPVVNWDVLNAITHDATEWARGQWNRLVH